MDVARIEAISPKQIDWRKLTAKEIIKYESTGVEVPPEYLQWARSFRADLEANDTDEVTYEKATSPQPQVQQNQDTAQTETPTEESDEITGANVEGGTEEDKTAAQAKREQLQNEGVSLRTQARIFTKDSRQASKETLQSAATIVVAQELSNNEIQALDSHMKEILSKAEADQNELKNEVAKINNNKNDPSSFGKINKLQKQLERYGNEGQADLMAAEGNFEMYGSTISAQSETILNAQDFGSETIGVGNDLLTSIRGHYFFRIIDFVIGRRAVKTGERTVDTSEKTAELQTQAQSLNSDNKSAVSGYKNEVENKTGVAPVATTKASDNQSSQEQENDSQKSVTGNEATETDKAASANLDQVLQAKIRKGEGINEG